MSIMQLEVGLKIKLDEAWAQIFNSLCGQHLVLDKGGEPFEVDLFNLNIEEDVVWIREGAP